MHDDRHSAIKDQLDKVNSYAHAKIKTAIDELKSIKRKHDSEYNKALSVIRASTQAKEAYLTEIQDLIQTAQVQYSELGN